MTLIDYDKKPVRGDRVFYDIRSFPVDDAKSLRPFFQADVLLADGRVVGGRYHRLPWDDVVAWRPYSPYGFPVDALPIVRVYAKAA